MCSHHRNKIQLGRLLSWTHKLAGSYEVAAQKTNKISSGGGGAAKNKELHSGDWDMSLLLDHWGNLVNISVIIRIIQTPEPFRSA